MGKTTLAVHWAHQIADRFPDGQLYVNLRGFDAASESMQPGEAIRGFLDAFSVPPDRIPASLSAQAALYRSMLADRRVLVVLDDARDADQVRPLLPASPTCLVLVTSRNPLTSLVAREGARPVPLDLLTPDEAIDLLSHHLGRDRVAAELDAARELVDHCASLPLALALMAARAAVNPRLTLRRLADELRDAPTRLDTLDADEPASGVRAVFSYSYRQLAPTAAQMFRLLGVHRGPDISLAAAASLAGAPLDETRRVLDDLTKAHLVTEDSPGRFALHDLLRAYAAERADDERQAALRRVLDHYLHTALAACAQLYPQRVLITPEPPGPGTAPEEISDSQEALTWYDAKYQALLTAIATAADTGFDLHTWQIAWTFASFLDQQGHWRDWVRSHQLALDAAERLADEDAQAKSHIIIAQAHGRLGDHDRASAHLNLALDLYQRLGDSAGQAAALGSLSWIYGRTDRYEEALAHSTRALELYRAAGNRLGESHALNSVGWIQGMLGNHGEAVAHGLEGLALARETGDRRIEAIILDSLGLAYHRLGDHARAVSHLRQAIALSEFSSTDNHIVHLDTLGDALHASGDPAGARAAWRQALRTAESLPNAESEHIRAKLRGS